MTAGGNWAGWINVNISSFETLPIWQQVCNALDLGWSFQYLLPWEKNSQLTSNVVEVTYFWSILRYFPNLKSFLQVCRCRDKLSIPCEFIQNDTCLEEYGESDRAHKMRDKSFQVGFTNFRKRLIVKEMGCWIQIFTTLILWQSENLDELFYSALYWLLFAIVYFSARCVEKLISHMVTLHNGKSLSL